MKSVTVPGRVNLIGEHIDYHGLPVLPMAFGRSIKVTFRPRSDRVIRATSIAPYGSREFEWSPDLAPTLPGDWENYIRAAARVAQMFLTGESWRGIDAEVTADLPPAAGLSSSTALLVAFTLALLQVNDHAPSFEQLMEVLPDGEQFVGTRGGGMDHAAVLASCARCASLIGFNPVSVRPIRIPEDWGFLVAHSLHTAEKSGSTREHYNSRRMAGARALEHLGFESYPAAIAAGGSSGKLENAVERDSFLHVTSEASRVALAASALEHSDPATFGRLLLESHASLRDRLQVSSPALDRLVGTAMECGALGARLTGAGFGGCVVILCPKAERPALRRKLMERYYAGRGDFREGRHLIDAEPASGVLCSQKT